MHKLFSHKILRMMKFSSIFYQFPYQEHTFSDAKPYVFGTETVKGCQLKQQ